ncbi:MAG: DUF2214 family protein [Phyllobacteriaceae bacterium]|nr:DUF2214 family protein [Phyllobacteriaceae bacterium]
MDWDLVLAAAHHLAVFTLVGIFAAEFAMVLPGLSGQRIGQLAKLDAAYGLMALIVIIVGALRVFLGAIDAGYYLSNFAFWAKMAAFLAMGLLTIPPTIAIRRWMKTAGNATDYVPPEEEITASRRYLHIQAGVLLLIPIFAAAMARGYGG